MAGVGVRRARRATATATAAAVALSVLPGVATAEVADGTTRTPIGTLQGPGAERPGPDLLYDAPLTDPGTAPAGRFVLPPTGVSGTTVVGDGELVWAGWPYDDHGADTIPVPLLNELLGADPSVTNQLFSARTGDLIYPTDRDRFATNAADLVEVRVRPDADGLALRFTLNTLLVEGVPAIAVGIDRTGSDEDVDWGRGLGTLGPTGVDHVLWTDGVDADLDGTPLAATTDLARGTIEVVVPDAALPLTDDDRLELFTVAGLSDGAGGFLAPGARPTADMPGGDPFGLAPPVFDVAFRADAQEPAGLLDPEGLSAQALTFGTWRSHAMATALADRDLSGFSATLDVGAVRAGEVRSDVPEAGTVQRTYTSRFDLGDAIGTERPFYRGARQPYTVHVPSCLAAGETPVLTLALHSLGGNHGQYLAASPGFYDQLGEDRCSLVVTPLGRGQDGWYLDEAEADLFEVLADVIATYDVDLSHTIIHGYSMGGYGTYRMVGRYPDLFAAAFPVVGPPFEGAVLLAGDLGVPELPLGFSPGQGQVDPTTDTTPLLASFRHVPMLAWHGTADQLVPVTSAITHLQTLEGLGYPYRQELFTADHFLLATVDRWTRATEVLGDRPEVTTDPDHVTFPVLPARDRPDLGLVADSAYWTSGLTARDADAGGLLDVRTLARDPQDVTTAPIADAGPAPLPFVARGLEATGTAPADAARAVEVTATGLATASLDLTAGRLPLSPTEDAEVRVTSDGPTVLTLTLAEAATVRDDGGADVVVDGTTVTVSADGDATVVLGAADPDPGDGDDGDGSTTAPGDDGAAIDGRPVATTRPLPVTGGGAPALVALLALAAAAALRRPSHGTG